MVAVGVAVGVGIGIGIAIVVGIAMSAAVIGRPWRAARVPFGPLLDAAGCPLAVT